MASRPPSNPSTPAIVLSNMSPNLRPAARAALDEWLVRTLHAPAAALVRHSGAAGAFVAAAPGARELVTIGKACDLAVGADRGPVILDAPSTGHALALLGAPGTYAALATG